MKIEWKSLSMLFWIFLPVVLSEREARDLSHHKGHGGYKPQPHLPKKCHPQTVTKYKTIHKDRKADVVNQIEVLNPRPHVKKVTEHRYTTIRYPVFITQVIKPVLTQVETKVKPVFFTETVNKYTTVLFTVTGIGQVTVTTVKFEKEYITRCMKKGGGGGYHRRSFAHEEEPIVREESIPSPLQTSYARGPQDIPPPPGIPYGEPFDGTSIAVGKGKRIYPRRTQHRRPPLIPPRSPLEPLVSPLRRRINRGKPLDRKRFPGRIGNIGDLYRENLFYDPNRSERLLETTTGMEFEEAYPPGHPPLRKLPVRVLI